MQPIWSALATMLMVAAFLAASSSGLFVLAVLFKFTDSLAITTDLVPLVRLVVIVAGIATSWTACWALIHYGERLVNRPRN